MSKIYHFFIVFALLGQMDAFPSMIYKWNDFFDAPMKHHDISVEHKNEHEKTANFTLLELKKFMGHSLTMAAKSCDNIEIEEIAKVQKFLSKLIAEKMMVEGTKMGSRHRELPVVEDIKKCSRKPKSSISLKKEEPDVKKTEDIMELAADTKSNEDMIEHAQIFPKTLSVIRISGPEDWEEDNEPVFPSVRTFRAESPLNEFFPEPELEPPFTGNPLFDIPTMMMMKLTSMISSLPSFFPRPRSLSIIPISLTSFRSSEESVELPTMLPNTKAEHITPGTPSTVSSTPATTRAPALAQPSVIPTPHRIKRKAPIDLETLMTSFWTAMCDVYCAVCDAEVDLGNVLEFQNMARSLIKAIDTSPVNKDHIKAFFVQHASLIVRMHQCAKRH